MLHLEVYILHLHLVFTPGVNLFLKQNSNDSREIFSEQKRLLQAQAGMAEVVKKPKSSYFVRITQDVFTRTKYVHLSASIRMDMTDFFGREQRKISEGKPRDQSQGLE